jgi:hypothetical protein
MPELTGSELLREWRKLMDSMIDTAKSLGRPDLPEQIAEPMRRQLELVEELIDRERRLQAAVTEQVFAPADIALDLLEQSGTTMRRQAEALEAAGDALRETAALMTSQAELFEGAIGRLRAPAEAARSVLGAERRSSGRPARGRKKPAR